MQLSEHFGLGEFIYSETGQRLGLDNIPSETVIAQLGRTARALEEVRTLLGHPILVLSGYRSPEVNHAVGGALNSQHVLGEAVDFICPAFGAVYDVAMEIANSDIKFDQLIYEKNWVHISFVAVPRGERLTKREVGYVTGIKEA